MQPRSSRLVGLALALMICALAAPMLFELWLEIFNANGTIVRVRPGSGLGRWLDLSFPLVLFAAATGLLAALLGRLWLLALLLLPGVLWLPAELFYLWNFKAHTSSHVFAVIGETNLAEAAAWLGPLGWASAAVTVLLLAASLALVWQLKRADLRWTGRSRWWVLAGMCAAGALLLAAEFATAEASHGEAGARPGRWADLEMAQNPRVAELEASYPYGLGLRIARVVAHTRALEVQERRLAEHRFGVADLPGAQANAVQVIVIGESSRSDRWQLYGYDRSTNPRLSQRAGLHVFTDVVTPASVTRVAVPLILTRRPIDSEFVFHDEPSVIAAFREAGFKTYWLSMQAAVGTHDTSIATLSREAHEARFINPAEYSRQGAFDEALLPELDRALRDPAPRKMIVLHTMGNHLNYRHRYPDAMDRFQPSLDPRESFNAWDPAERTRMSNAYDNSVAYVDWFLDEVIERLASRPEPSSLLFVSDHGQTLFEGSCGKAGHGFPSVHNYRVPFVVWTSSAWLAANPEQAKALERNAPRSAVARATFETALDLGRIGFAGRNSTASLASASYAEDRRQIVLNTGAVIDFDRDFPRHDCARQP